MSAQRYSSPLAQERMAAGNCPECGKPINAHSGWGLGTGSVCTLTDNGVAARIAQFQADQESS